MNYCLAWSDKEQHTEDIIYFDSEAGFAVPGFTVVLLHKDYISRLSARANSPDMFDFLLMHKMKSVVNTPFTLCTFVLHENIKYLTENRELICKQTLECKRAYKKMLMELGYIPNREHPEAD